MIWICKFYRQRSHACAKHTTSLVNKMASRVNRPRLKRVTESATKRRVAKWGKENPRITLGDQFSRWVQFKQENDSCSNTDAARILLDHWYASSVRELHGASTVEVSTPVQGPSTSTPGPCHLHPLKSKDEHLISDVSDIEVQSSDMSGVEAMSDVSRECEDVRVLRRYEEKALENEGSFIQISYEEIEEPNDPTYSPSQSDIEEEDADLDIEFEMSLCTPQTNQAALEMLPIVGDVDIDDSRPDDDEGDVPVDSESSDDPVTEKKFICFESCLKELAAIRMPSHCQRKGCDGEIGVKCRYVGSSAQLIWTCSNGHNVHTWNSQPRLKKVYVGNVLLSAAILMSGNNYQKISLLFQFLNLGMISSTSHLRVQRTFTVPVIDSSYQTLMRETINKYKGKELVVAGDARNDSPGHTAMYCTYTFIEYETKDIVSSIVIDKRMTNMKSINMEKEGMLRAMKSLLDEGVLIKEVCTDAHTQIASMLKKDYPLLKHSFDTWHGAKNFGKKMTAVAAETRNKDLRPWVQDLVNHFWYCSRKAQGSEMALISRWRGILHHVTDVHEWVIGDGAGPAQCEHDPILTTEDMESKWLEPGSEPHASLAKVILDTRLLHNLNYYVNFRHTGELENFHEHILMYAAKRFAYSYPMYKARNQLAVIDYQKHKERAQATNRQGEPIYARKYSKRNKNWSAVPVKEKKKYVYIPQMMEEILSRLAHHEGPLPTRFPPEEGDPRLIKRTIAEVSPIPTKELVAKKKSRFQ